MPITRLVLAGIAGVWLGVARPAAAQSLDPRLYQDLAWRSIGPHRGGRTKAAAGIPGRPNEFYVGAVNGGVWKTTDFGRTWQPIFDDQPTGSVGALAIAPSDPDVIYVGSGEGLQRPDLSTGDGIYRSGDGGRTWRHLGLRDGQQIPQIAVDPRNPNRLFVAVMGHPYGPNPERGLYLSTDGAETFRKVLFRDENTGAVDVVLDPVNPDVVYAVLWEARQAPWENGFFYGPGSGLYKSVDGGATWRQLTRGLPTYEDGLGRIGITVAPSDPARLYASVEVGGAGRLFRSDDAGESWYRVTDDARVVGRPSDFAEVKVDPTNPDVVYTGSVVAWKSTDGGKTFTAFRGAPGGDDYQRIWINPANPKIILIAADQGVIITVNGGATWSSWYNQPTAQFYHVSTDNAIPYRVCGGQQESGSACVASRGNDGQITFREWHPVGVEEYGYVAPDPLDPDIVFGGKVTRHDRRTGQTQDVAPLPFRGPDYRMLRTAPLLFSPVNPRALYFGANAVWKTLDGGRRWARISPDLTRRDSVVPPNVMPYQSRDEARARHPGVVYTLGLSPIREAILWAGTDDGLIQVTFDGGRRWRNVTPPTLGPWAKVSIIDPSHFDSLTAYAAINTLRLDDLRPHLLRTRDGGRSWTEIGEGIPGGAPVNVIREDPRRRGLLFAGTERTVYVSFDDGDHWQSLRLNLPATSIRDLVIKDDDLVIGTHGRGFWILDAITPLRQITAATAGEPVLLFRPQTATRVRWNTNTDTPLPPDEPRSPNPPDGAVLDYWLGRPAVGPVVLEVLDSAGALVRRYSSEDPVPPIADEGNVPALWIRPVRVPSREAGMHRFVWDLRYPPPPVRRFHYPIAAVPGDTPREPRGPWVLPGRYRVRLTVDGRAYTAPLVVRIDPRVRTPMVALRRQLELSRRMVAGIGRAGDALARIESLRVALRDRRSRAPAELLPTIDSVDAATARLVGTAPGPRPAGGAADTFSRLSDQLLQLYELLQGADVAPTTQAGAAIRDRSAALEALERAWERLQAGPLPRLDARLRREGLAPLPDLR